MKQWRMEQAKREGHCESMVSKKLAKGLYPNLKLRKVNRRVIFVKI